MTQPAAGNPFLINRTSTADQVAALVRSQIIRGELPPGTSLREASLAASFGVSRNTLREAIRVLVHDGLVKHSIHRGAAVTALSEADVADLYRIRQILEIGAVDRLAEGFPNGLLDRLERTVDHIGLSIERGDSAGGVECDLLFHRQLVEVYGSPRLDHFYMGLLTELRLGLVLLDLGSDSSKQLAHQHRALLELLKNRELEQCKASLALHLTESERSLRETVRTFAGRAG